MEEQDVEIERKNTADYMDRRRRQRIALVAAPVGVFVLIVIGVLIVGPEYLYAFGIEPTLLALLGIFAVLAGVMIFVFSVPLVLVKPHVGVLVWSWISYMNPHRLTWGSTYDFPVAMVAGSATLIGWLLSREPKKLPADGITFAILALAAWVSVTTVFALVPEQAYLKWDKSMKILLMTLVTLALITTRKRLNLLIWVIVASIGFYGVRNGLSTVLGGMENIVWGPPESFIADNNSLALALLMVVPWMRYLQMQGPNKWVRWGMAAAMALTVAAIAGSYSRAAFLALVVMLAFLVIKSRRRVLFGIVLIGGCALSLPFLPDKWIERMETIQTYEQDASAMGRIHAWTYAYKLALARPLVGGGFMAYRDEARFMRYVPDASEALAAHSVYFEMLGEHGFLGLALFLLIWIWSYRACAITIRRTRGSPDLTWANDLARMTQVSLVGYAIAGAFTNLALFDLYYHVVAVALIAKTLALGRATDAKPSVPWKEAAGHSEISPPQNMDRPARRI